MVVKLADLAAELRLGDGTTAPTGPVGAILTRILTISTEIVGRYAPHASEEAQDAAIIRVAAYLYDTDPSGSRSMYPNAMTQSGAAALLDMYRGPTAHELGSRSPAAAAPSGDGGEVIDQTARDEAAAALARAIGAESDAAEAATAASVADSKATSAATAASHASTAAATALETAHDAEDEAGEAKAAAAGAARTAQRAQGAATAAAGAARTAQATAEAAQQTADDAQHAATGAQGAVDGLKPEVTALETRLDAVAARTPSSDPPASRAWATDEAGTPAWREERSGVTVSSRHSEDWADWPTANGWLWELERGPDDVYLYPVDRATGSRLTDVSQFPAFVRYIQLHFFPPPDDDTLDLSVDFRRRSEPAQIVESPNIGQSGAIPGETVRLVVRSNIEFSETSAPVEASALDIEWRYTRTTVATRAEAVLFDGIISRVATVDGVPTATVEPQAAYEAQEAAEDAHVRADLAHALAAQAQAAADRAQEAADAAAAAAAAIAGMPVPTSAPPSRSYWGTADGQTGAWLPVQPLSHVQVVDDEAWGDWRDIANPDGWHFALHQARGIMLLTPTSFGSPLMGDTDRVTLLRYIDAHLPFAHVQFRRRGANGIHPGEGAQPRYIRVVETDDQGTLAIEMSVDARLLPDLAADQHNQLPSGLNLEVSPLAHGASIAAHAVRFRDMSVTGTGPQVEVYAGTREIRTSVSVETARRTAADNALADRITAEQRNREAGDTTVTGLVDAEAAARQAADGVLDARTPTAPARPSSHWATDEAGNAAWRTAPTSGVSLVVDDRSDGERLPRLSEALSGWELEKQVRGGFQYLGLTPLTSGLDLSFSDELHAALVAYVRATFPDNHTWLSDIQGGDYQQVLNQEIVPTATSAGTEYSIELTLDHDAPGWLPGRYSGGEIPIWVSHLTQVARAESMVFPGATVTAEGTHVEVDMTLARSAQADATEALGRAPTADPPRLRVWGTYGSEQPSWERGRLLVRQVQVQPWGDVPGNLSGDASHDSAFQSWSIFVQEGDVPGIYIYPQSYFGSYGRRILHDWRDVALGGAPSYLRRRSAPNEIALVESEPRLIDRLGRTNLVAIRLWPLPYFHGDIDDGAGLTPAQLPIQLARRNLIQGVSIDALDVEGTSPIFGDLPVFSVATLRP